MKVIQLCGTNGVGKTTAVWQFCEKHNLQSKEPLLLNGKKIKWHSNEDETVIVLGEYGKTACGGIDGKIDSAVLLKYVVLWILSNKKPQYLIFEGVVFGITFKLRYEISRICERYGYEYVAVCLIPPFETSIKRTIERSGNTNIKVESISSKYFNSFNAISKLNKAGVKTVICDTSKIEIQDMHTIVENEL